MLSVLTFKRIPRRPKFATAAAGSAPRTPYDDERLGLRYSIVFHAALAFAIALKCLIFPGKPTLYIPTLRVDVVDLPDQLKNQLIHAPRTTDDKIAEALKQAEQQARKVKALPKASSKQEMADKNEMVLKPKQASKDQEKAREKRLMSALNRIKALEKISGDSQADRKKKTATILIKGNKISKGTSLSADAREATQANYYDQVRDKLQENWALPVWLSRQDLSAQVVIFIDRHGRLINMVFQKSSGNPQFDAAVKKTVGTSQPFDPPPPDLASEAMSNGIRVGFPL